MTEDRNKTALTKKVTAAALGYLDKRGCKPIETEVPVCNGWVADLAAVLRPTVTELVLLKLIKRRPKYNQPGYQDWQLATRQAQRLMTVLVEVKASRSDFRRDRKWSLEAPTNLAYLAIPNDLTAALSEVPSCWGILVYSAASSCVRCLRPPAFRDVPIDQQLAAILEIAIRRDNHTRYERMRELQRSIRENQNTEISRTRTLSAMKAMKSIVEGKHGSVNDALQYYGVKHMPTYFMAELEKLWAIAPDQASTDKDEFTGAPRENI